MTGIQSAEAIHNGTGSLPTPPVPEALPRVASRQGRIAWGKALRKVVSRSAQGTWEPPSDRPDPVEILQEADLGRLPHLLPIRYGRMLASPFAFFRSAAAVMASDLASTPNTGIRVQAGGDAHVGNFGAFATPDRNVTFDLHSFDETLPAPWEWDVKRLVASFAVAGRELGFDAKSRRTAVLTVAREYRKAITSFASMRNLEVWYSRLDVAGIAARWSRQVSGKQEWFENVLNDFIFRSS